FINKSDSEVKFNGNDAELYFEEDNFDTFVERLSTMKDIDYVHCRISIYYIIKISVNNGLYINKFTSFLLLYYICL
ncbi:hypothetical protein ACTPD5_21340, partial [Clostridioides difficile]